MTKAEQVYERRKKALYIKYLDGTDTNVKKIFFDFILDILDKKTENADYTDIYIFRGQTKTVQEYSIQQDGFYHYSEKILSFDQPVELDQMMDRLYFLINRHNGFYANKQPYKRYHDEALTYYLQIGMK